MSIEQWNERYRSGQQVFTEPSPLVVRYSAGLAAGDALDLACGPGRNALYLAAQGWRVSAIDGSPLAIEILGQRATERKLTIDARVSDLEREDFAIPQAAYGLICDCYFLERSLFPKVRLGARPGGIVIVIVHLADPGQRQGTRTRAVPGELRSHFSDWKILHDYEGASREASHQRPVAELVAQKPRQTD